jgi:hypothetical protein
VPNISDLSEFAVCKTCELVIFAELELHSSKPVILLHL